MPGGDSLTRRRFLMHVGLLVPASAIVACRDTAAPSPVADAEPLTGPRRAPHTSWALDGGRVTVYGTVGGRAHTALCWFNDAGGRIWQALDGRRGPEELAAELAPGPGEPVDSADIVETTMFIVRLAELGLVDGRVHFTLERCEIGQTA